VTREGDAMQDALQAYVDKRTPGSAFLMRYHIGNTFSGETDFRLRGDGTYDLWSTVTEGRRRRTYAGRIEDARVERLAALFLESRIWEAHHLRQKPAMDDPRATIAVESGGQASEVSLWASEIPDSPPFATAQRELLALIHDLSMGEILEGGR
jgi:hypothetical protein